MELNNAIKILGETFNANLPAITPAQADPGTSQRFWITKYGSTRFWAVYDEAALVAVTVYKKGATEVYNACHQRAPASVRCMAWLGGRGGTRGGASGGRWAGVEWAGMQW